MQKDMLDHYLHILKEELIIAMGCTEPIALAYAGAVARQHLGALPDKAIADCSGNMLKPWCRTNPTSTSAWEWMSPRCATVIQATTFP